MIAAQDAVTRLRRQLERAGYRRAGRGLGLAVAQQGLPLHRADSGSESIVIRPCESRDQAGQLVAYRTVLRGGELVEAELVCSERVVYYRRPAVPTGRPSVAAPGQSTRRVVVYLSADTVAALERWGSPSPFRVQRGKAEPLSAVVRGALAAFVTSLE